MWRIENLSRKPAVGDLERVIEKLRVFAGEGGDIELRSVVGDTLLHLACCHDCSGKLATTLLELGAEVDALDICGGTPAHEAAACGNIKALRILLGRGANTSAQDEQGQTPLDEARRRNKRECELLLDSVNKFL